MKPSGKDFGYMFAFVPMLFILFWGFTSHREVDAIVYSIFYVFAVWGIVALLYWILSYTNTRPTKSKKGKKGKNKGGILDQVK